MNKTLLFSCFVLIAISVFGQQKGPQAQREGQTSISGEVLDSVALNGIEYASVRLFSVADSSVKQGIYTDEKGRFLLEKVAPGNYFIKITFSGYEPKLIPNIKIQGQPVYALGKIGLSKGKLQNIQEVTVTADVDVLKAGIDKKIYNVEEDLSTRGGNAEDILNNIPSVEVDQDGKVSLRGDGNVTILIDGRPSSFTGGTLSGVLDAIPASSIERIEVVTNPSAKYDPDGTSGIINIVLKKNKLKGFNGQVTASMATGHDHNFNGALSYRNSKFNIYGSYAFDYNRGFRNNFGFIEQYYANDSVSRLNQDRKGSDFGFGHNARIGGDWYINSQNTLSLSVTGQSGYRERNGDQVNENFDSNGVLQNSWTRISADPSDNLGLDANLNLTHLMKKDKGKWSFDFSNSNGTKNEDGEYEQYFTVQNGIIVPQDVTSQRLNSNGSNTIFTGQFDLEYVLTKINGRIETGAKTIVRNESLATSMERMDPGTSTFVLDSVSNFDYTYYENINSIYGIFGQQLGKFKYQLGIRAEYAEQAPTLKNDPTNYSKTYFNAFPSGHVKYKTSEKSELSLSYSRRINRPQSGQLNPFTSYADPVNLRGGNPNLTPEFINSYDLGFSYDAKLFNIVSSVFYRNTKDVIQRVKLFYPNNTSIVTFENIDQSNSLGMELVLSIRPTKWWKNTLSWNGDYVEFVNSSTTTNWNNTGFNWSLKYVASFDFWKKSAVFQINANYSAPRTTAQGKVNPWTFVNISVEKLVLNKKLAIGLRLSDVFNTKGFKMFVDQPTVIQESEFKFLTRRLYFSLSYKFGKLEMSKQRGGGGEGGMDF